MSAGQPIGGYDDRRMRAIDDDIGDHSESQLLFRSAIAYAEVSESVFQDMIDGRLKATFDHAKVAHYLLDHSLELFFKGALRKRGNKYPKHHRLDELFEQYRREYPESGYEFSGRADDTFTKREGAPFGQFARYPVNKSGEKWDSCNCYTIAIWFEQAQLYSQDIKRLVKAISPLPPPAFSSRDRTD